MILSDRDIEEEIRAGRLVISPLPDPSQIASTAIDLRVGDDFRRWKKVLTTPGLSTTIDLDNVNIAHLLDLTEPVLPMEGCVHIQPDDFVLVRTLEDVTLPLESQLAARVEGRSTFARFGMSVHVTAPTIHAGFSGRITLEILNHGPFTLRVTPGITKICQLILERVSSQPKRDLVTPFVQQATPLGTPDPSV